jgi:hypothetical protein
MKVKETIGIANAVTGLETKEWRFECPGCKCRHRVVGTYGDGRQAWTFNGSLENPTLNPSILVTYGANPPSDRPARCHSYVREGNIQFLGDCTHELKGQTVPLPEMD